MVACQAALQGTDDSHGPYAEHQAGSNESLGDGNAASFLGKAPLHPSPQSLDFSVQIQKLTQQRPDDNRQN